MSLGKNPSQYDVVNALREVENNKVDKINGKGLSTNDFTTTLLNKLNGIEAGAEVNPTKLSELTNDSGFITNSSLPTKTSDLTNDSGFLTSIPSEYITETELTAKGYAIQSSLNTTNTNLQNEITNRTNADAELQEQIDSISTHTHSNKTILDNTTASYTSAEKTKLSGIATGAEVNVQSDWSVTNTSSDAYIKNKPTIPTVDTAVSTTSTNTVRNSAITSYVDTNAALLATNKIGAPKHSTKVALSVSTDFNYTPTKNGYIIAHWWGGLSDGSWFGVWIGTSQSNSTKLIGYNSGGYNHSPTMVVPVKKGETYRCSCNSTSDYRFYFAQGSGE